MGDNLTKPGRRQKTGSFAPLKRAPQRKAVSSPHIVPVKRSGESIKGVVGCRHEIKYIVSESTAKAIARFVEPYLPVDKYSKMQPTGEYPVVSLYLDSHNFQLCRESMEGHKNRFKLRIRSYTDDPDYPRFLEIKRRMNSIIIKNRIRIKDHHVSHFLSGRSLPSHYYSTDEKLFKQFRLYMDSINAAPVVKVRYMRQAYENDLENRVRVTLDRELAFKVSDKHDVSLNGTGWQFVPTKGVILEIKFSDYYPGWLNQMIRCFDLRAESVSKYVRSIQKGCSLRFCEPQIPIRTYRP